MSISAAGDPPRHAQNPLRTRFTLPFDEASRDGRTQRGLALTHLESPLTLAVRSPASLKKSPRPSTFIKFKGVSRNLDPR